MSEHTIEHMRLEANGQIFHVAACGPKDAPPMMLLHGFPEGWMSWREVMLELAGKWRLYAPDLRGYGGSDRPAGGYDVITLTNDVRALMEALQLQKPVLVGHDWGGGLAWVFAHRFSQLISKLVVVNCTHPRTLQRAFVERTDGQLWKSWYMAAFQVPWLPELLATAAGGAVLKRAYKSMEGRPGAMNQALVDELVATFKTAGDIHGPINFYRAAAKSSVLPGPKAAMDAVFATPISVPCTMVWGDQDKALSEVVGKQSHREAGCDVEWRPLPGVGHFVSLEAPGLLAQELARAASK